jgi:hypothetical protein
VISPLLLRLVARVLLCGLGVVITLFFPVRRGLVLEVFLLVVGGLVLETLVRATALAQPAERDSAFESALRWRRRAGSRPDPLVRLEDQVSLAVASALDLHTRLLPALREVAGELLLTRRGIDLQVEPDAAREALGEDAWALLRADLGPPADRFGKGISPARLRKVVEAVEAI